MIKFGKTARHHCGVFAVWKKSRDNVSLSMRIAQKCFRGARSGPVRHGPILHAGDVDTNDPICIRGVDIQVAFYAVGLPDPFQDMFARDPVEAWEVDVARVVDGALWIPGMPLCIPFLLWFLWVGIKLWTSASGYTNT